MINNNAEQPHKNHCFVVLAYKESRYIESCIKSLKKQSLATKILVSTSTPNHYLKKLCYEYSLPLMVNDCANPSIGSDWNFALGNAPSRFVTLAHQDDIYCPDYCEKILQGNSDFLIAFSDYYEIFEERLIKSNLNLFIKRLLLWPFLFNSSISSRFLKKQILSFGSPICCPSVTYNKKEIGNFNFEEKFGINMDWHGWLRIAEKPGFFKRLHHPLMYHRIHQDSETSAGLMDHRRRNEDLKIFQGIWGKSIGRVLAKIYRLSYSSNSRGT